MKKRRTPRKLPKKFTAQQIDSLPHYTARKDNAYIADLYGMTEDEFGIALSNDEVANKAYQTGRRGRPRKVLTPTQINEIEQISGKLSDERLAGLYGMTIDTFKRILKDDEPLFRAYKRGKATLALQMTDVIIESALGGNAPMACFYLKCREGWREVKEPINEQGDNNSTVTLRVIGADGELVTPSKDIIDNGKE